MKNSVWKKILLLAGSLLFSIVLCEAVFRIAAFPPDRSFKILKENPHQTGSYRLKNNFFSRFNIRGNIIEIQTNSQGMAWRETEVKKPFGMKRVAFAGDSFVMGEWATHYQNSFVGVFDDLIRDKGKIEALNFGVSGYGLMDIELQLAEKILKFSPDYLVLGFYAGNDFRDTYLGPNKYDIRQGNAKWAPTIFESIPADYRSESSAAAATPRLAWLRGFLGENLNVYRFFSFLKERKLFKDDQRREDFYALDVPFVGDNNFKNETFWSKDPYPPIAQGAKVSTLESLDRIQQICDRHDIRLIVFAIPYKLQIFAQKNPVEGYIIDKPQEILKLHCRRNGIIYLNPLNWLRSYVRKGNKEIFLMGDVHFNNLGHKVLGEYVFNKLKNKIPELQ